VSGTSQLRIGVVVTTVGRWEAIERLLGSVRESTYPATAIAIANQSGGPAPLALSQAHNVEIVDSSGGISRGRNDAMQLLKGATDVMSFPNDHSTLQADTFARASHHFSSANPPGALAGTLLEPTGVRFVLPASGTELTDWTVWRAIEPAMFIASRLAEDLRFREDLGTGNSSPWQAGEGTELLLRIMHSGNRVVAAPEVIVRSDGERRELTPEEWRVKLRSYARGTGYVLRLHHCGLVHSALQIGLPWYRFLRRPPSGARVPARDCFEATIGRFEGRIGRCLGDQQFQLSEHALKK
jgi:hypothetical protein